jgi:nucleosome assembly protein 1-like 1
MTDSKLSKVTQGVQNLGVEDNEGEEEEDYVKQFIESLPESVQECVKALDVLDKDVESLQTNFRKELRELERKYQALKAPVFAKRANIISGDEKPAGTNSSEGIPDFWLGCLMNCNRIAPSITEKDQPILKSLINITAATLPEEEGIGYRLEFSFKPNEYFNNEKLTKTYYMADTDEDPLLEKCVGTAINWNAGKNVTVVTKKKKQRNKKGSGSRIVTKVERCDSFFNFFDPPKIPEPDDPVEDDTELLRRKTILEVDYEIGVSIRDKIVPHAVKWFTGEAEDDDYDDEDYEEEGMEELDEDDDDN